MKTALLTASILLLLGAGCAASPSVQEPPIAEQPIQEPALSIVEDPVYGPSAKSDMIVLDKLQLGDAIASPIVLTGKARGRWYFEASFPIELVDSQNVVVATGSAQAQSDWMTTDFVPFAATLTFLAPAQGSATLVFKKDNPSGEPQNDDQMRFPVSFAANAVNPN